MQRSPAARPTETARAPARSLPDKLALATPTPPAAPPVRASPSPNRAPVASPAPLLVESQVQANAAPAVARPLPSVEQIGQANPAPDVALPAPGVEPHPQSVRAPATIAAPLIAQARPQMRTPPGPAPATIPPPGLRPRDDAQDYWVMQGRRMLADTVPRVAAQAEPEVSRVLWAAALAEHPLQVQAVLEASYAGWSSVSAWIPASNLEPAYARRLHNDARHALASGRDVPDAINVELRAFGANPRDPDIAGYLAFLHLQIYPAQAETARQLTLHAIAVSGSRRSTRSDDWGTLAVASALTGRQTDAIRAYLAEIALTNDIDRSCRSALSAYANFGERLRVPVQAMLYRVRSLRRAYEYPSCAWPSYWNAAARSPGVY